MRLITILLVILLCVTFANADIKPVQFTLSVTYAGLTAADTALTIYGTSHLGLVETNRLLAPLIDRKQYAAVWAVGVLQVAALTGICHWLISSGERVPRVIGYAILVTSVVFRGYVVIHNIRLHSRVN